MNYLNSKVVMHSLLRPYLDKLFWIFKKLQIIDVFFIMTELNDFIKGANASEQCCFNVATLQPIPTASNNNEMPSLESFDSKHMSRAWRVCWGTTTLILLFLLFLWFYFAFYFENKTEDQLWNLRSSITSKNAKLTIRKVIDILIDLSL